MAYIANGIYCLFEQALQKFYVSVEEYLKINNLNMDNITQKEREKFEHEFGVKYDALMDEIDEYEHEFGVSIMKRICDYEQVLYNRLKVALSSAVMHDESQNLTQLIFGDISIPKNLTHLIFR